jgi:two-component system, NarL family, nitrate/nitrite response regulator NarL
VTGAGHFRLPDGEASGALALSSWGAFNHITSFLLRNRKRCEFVPVALIDKCTLFRAGLRHVLSGSRFRVMADCHSISDLPSAMFNNTSSVAFVGLDRDTRTILPQIWSLKQTHKGLRILVFSNQLDPEQLVTAIDAGVAGYLLRDEIGPDAVLKCLELVLAGGFIVPQGFTKLLSSATQAHASAPEPAPMPEPGRDNGHAETRPPECAPPARHTDATPNDDWARLSERERTILRHLTEGASNKHIARELNIAEATVKVHVKSLLRKIRVNNRTQAAMWAIGHAHAGQVSN